MKHLMTKIIPLFLLLFLTSQAFGQSKTVSGNVKDNNGNPVADAIVSAVGSSATTVTEEDGSFSITVPDGTTQLYVKAIGAAKLTHTISGTGMQSITVATTVKQLEGTVVTALGIKRSERSLGYSVQKVDGDDLTKTRDANLVNSLYGKVSGVQISGSSNIGGSSRILIRGMRSITGNNQPLFVVDGVPMDNSNFTTTDQARGGGGYDYGNAIQDINPEDIEEISILKGVNATSLYGSRGSNGVVLITTKKGAGTNKDNALGVNFSYGYTWDNPLILPDYQNEYGGGSKLTFDTVNIGGTDFQVPRYNYDESWGPKMEGQQVRKWNSFDPTDGEHYGKTSDWSPQPNNVKDFLQTGKTSQASFSVNGGNADNNFRLSYGLLSQTGIIPNSSLKRHNVGLAANGKVSKRIKAMMNINYSNNAGYGRPGTGYDSDYGLNTMQMFNQWYQRQLNTEDLKNYKNPDGTQRSWNRQSATNPSPKYWDNPYWTVYENYQNDTRDRIFGNMGVSMDLGKGFEATAKVYNDMYSERREERVAKGSVGQSRYALTDIFVRETNYEGILYYRKELSPEISYQASLGGNARFNRRTITEQETVGGLGLAGFYNIANSVSRPELTQTLVERQINSFFTTQSIGYRNKLFVDMSVRRDKSSTVNDAYLYPGVSASWIVRDGSATNRLSFMKFRLGWASAGKDANPYQLYDKYSATNNYGNLSAFAFPNQGYNRDLKPEITRSWEGGMESFFFGRRLSLNLTGYYTKSFNQIVNLGTSGASGITSKVLNTGLVINKGIEIELGGTPVQRENFRWDLKFNYAANRNRIERLADDAESLPIVNAPFSAQLAAFEGQSWGTILGTDYLYGPNGEKLVNPANGTYYTTSSVVPIGSILPKWTGGFSSNMLLWKRLGIYAMIDARIGGEFFSTTNMWGKYSGLFSETVANGIRENGIVVEGYEPVLDANGNPTVIDEGNPNVLGDEIYEVGNTNSTSVSATSHFLFNGGYFLTRADVYDASFVKFRELSIAYTLNPDWLGRVGIKGATVSFVGRNLAILHSQVPHIDPEVSVSSGNIQGIEGGQLPSTRSLGIKLSMQL